MKKWFGLLTIVLLYCALASFTSRAENIHAGVQYSDVKKVNTAKSDKQNKALSRVSNQNDTVTEKPVIKQPYEPSVIEKMFNSEKNPVKLKQWGYEIFENSSPQIITSKIPGNYRLKIGDKVNVYLWGDTIDLLNIAGNNVIQSNSDAIVDKEGNIFIPGIGLISAEDNTLSNVEKKIFSSLSGKFSGFKVKVTVEEPGIIPVMVMGNVKKPGIINVNNTCSLIDALTNAGGIQKDGSLRNIVHINSAGHKTNIDLYQFILKGNVSKIKLTEGDTILVKPVGSVIAINNGVKKPAIYEIKHGESIKDSITYAGGMLPSVNQKTLRLESFDNAGNQKIIQDISAEKFSIVQPKDGDSIEFRPLYNYSENTVTLEGNIKHPEKYEYKKGMKLSDILRSNDELLSQTNLYQALIIRVQDDDKDVEVIPISLFKFFKGSINPELKPQDVIKISRSSNMESVEAIGQINNPGYVPYKPDMTLKDLLSTVELNESPNNLVAEISNSNILESDRLEINKEASQNTETQKNINQGKTRFRVIYLYELLTKNKDELNIELFAGDKINFRHVTSKEALRTVKIFGYVNKPGVYKIKPGMRINDVIEEACGLSKNAYLKGITFLRPSILQQQNDILSKTILKLQEDIALNKDKVNKKIETETSPNKTAEINRLDDSQRDLSELLQARIKQNYGRIVINIKDDAATRLSKQDNLEVMDGDEIIIPPMPEHVIIMGEVYNQSAIAYIPKRSAEYYLNNVGGITKQANKKEIHIVKINGITTKVNSLKICMIEPGDSIIVPRKIKVQSGWLNIIKETSQLGFNALSTVFILTKI